MMRSDAEEIVCSWLEEQGYEVVRNDRTLVKSPGGSPMEIDIYLPKEKFAIECNGEKYHEELPLDYFTWYQLPEKNGLWRGYHKWKEDKLADRSIRLISVVSEDVRDFPYEIRRHILWELEKWINL